jgi:hypothetical protein
MRLCPSTCTLYLLPFLSILKRWLVLRLVQVDTCGSDYTPSNPTRQSVAWFGIEKGFPAFVWESDDFDMMLLHVSRRKCHNDRNNNGILEQVFRNCCRVLKPTEKNMSATWIFSFLHGELISGCHVFFSLEKPGRGEGGRLRVEEVGLGTHVGGTGSRPPFVRVITSW